MTDSFQKLKKLDCFYGTIVVVLVIRYAIHLLSPIAFLGSGLCSLRFADITIEDGLLPPLDQVFFDLLL